MRDRFLRCLSVLAAVCVLFPSAGCLTAGGPEAEQPPSQLEYRSMQTRVFDTPEPAVVMKALMNVLQDLGYVIKNAEPEVGLVTAEKWTNITHSKKERKKAAKDEVALAATQLFECSANITQVGTQCRVRVNFQRKLFGPQGAILDVDVVDDPAFYQQFLSSVDKGVFLQEEGL